MPAVLRILRSNATGVRPAGRQDGEPYVNYSDRQWGVWDGNTAQPMDLLAIRWWSPTTAYVVEDLVVSAGVIYRCLFPHTNQPPPNVNWEAISGTNLGGGGGGGIADAPSDGQLYGRENAAWVVVPVGPGGGIPDAPSDGTTYGRLNAAWTAIIDAGAF